MAVDRATRGRVARLHAAYRDLEEAKGYCALLKRFAGKHSELHQPLLIAIVVTYCKPFTAARDRTSKSSWGDGHSRPILDGGIYPATPSAYDVVFGDAEDTDEGTTVGMMGLKRAWREMHTKLMGTLRHMNYAHSDGTARAPYLDYADTDEALEMETLMSEDIPVIEEMCEAAMKAVAECIRRAEAGDLTCVIEDCPQCASSSRAS